MIEPDDAKPVEQFTTEMVPAGKRLTLKLSWDKTVASRRHRAAVASASPFAGHFRG